LIDKYIEKHRDLDESQMTILHFHAGQMIFLFAGMLTCRLRSHFSART
jgi:hypothetical protein